MSIDPAGLFWSHVTPLREKQRSDPSLVLESPPASRAIPHFRVMLQLQRSPSSCWRSRVVFPSTDAYSCSGTRQRFEFPTRNDNEKHFTQIQICAAAVNSCDSYSKTRAEEIKVMRHLNMFMDGKQNKANAAHIGDAEICKRFSLCVCCRL